MILALRHRPRLFYALLYSGFFIVVLAIVSGMAAVLIQRDLEAHSEVVVEELEDFALDVLGTMNALDQAPAVAPCSEPFLRWMRTVAFRPDRINEIMYAPNGLVECSVGLGVLDTPIALGLPDFVIVPQDLSDKGLVEKHTYQIWEGHDLRTFDLPNVEGLLLGFQDFVLVVPDMPLLTPIPEGITFETVWRSSADRTWHRGGVPGLYSKLTGVEDAESRSIAIGPSFTAVLCDSTGANCIAVVEPVLPLLWQHMGIVSGIIALVASLAAVLTYAMRGIVNRAWSLSSRVRKRLSAENVACHYQPLLDTRTNHICAVEVLVRWNDDDGTLVAPDAFLPIIEKYGLQRRLTRLVVKRAFGELSKLNAGPRPLKVHFNIFPIDFDPDWMIELFKDFLGAKDRFTVVIELVESDMLPIESTREAVARLKKAGILTYIDDFGEGYSSIGYLAGLGTQGVKLDRSFGMAPEGSLMDALMVSAIDMVAKTGQVLLVEGVETAERLASLRANANVDMAQGYFISRPLDIAGLEEVLGETAPLSKSWAA